MIGTTLDVIGGYNRLCHASERERDTTKKAFLKTYNELTLSIIAKSIHLDSTTRKELSE